MLPNVDPVTQNVSSSTGVYQRRADYKVTDQTEAEALTSEKTAEAGPAQILEQNRSKNNSPVLGVQDQVELNFSLTRDEKEAFVNAFSKKQDPATMTEEEQETLKKAAERISKFVEETIARNTSKRERVEKAVAEWYDKLSQGETEGERPTDLLSLLRKAAMGTLGGFWER